LGTDSPLAPESMIGSLAAVDLPLSVRPSPTDRPSDSEDSQTHPLDPLRDALFHEDRIEVPVFPWPHTPSYSAPKRRLLRVSAQIYNEPADYDRLIAALSARS
jgi:isopenicillin-N epimerase